MAAQLCRLLPLLALSLAVACKSDDPDKDGSTDQDGGNETGTHPTTRPACDDTSIEPIVPMYQQVVDPATGTNVFLTGPENPTAVMWIFHGSGGEAWHQRQTHQTRLWNVFNAVGVGMIGPESVDRGEKVWDMSETDNVDFENLKTIRQHYIEQGLFTAETPIIVYGFSNGGAFSQVFVKLALDDGWPIQSAVVFSARWNEALVPAYFTIPENDDLLETIQNGYDGLLEAHADVAQTVVLEHPWGRIEMILNPDYDDQMSSDVFDELVSFHMIDEKGIRLVDTENVDQLMGAYEGNSTLPGPDRVTGMVRVAWATHRPPSETSCELRDFVLDRL